MSESRIPILQLDLTYMAEHIKHSAMLRHGELDQMICDAVDKICTEEYLRARIENAVKQMFDNAIDKMATDYNAQQIITGVVNDALFKLRERLAEERDAD